MASLNNSVNRTKSRLEALSERLNSSGSSVKVARAPSGSTEASSPKKRARPATAGAVFPESSRYSPIHTGRAALSSPPASPSSNPSSRSTGKKSKSYSPQNHTAAAIANLDEKISLLLDQPARPRPATANASTRGSIQATAKARDEELRRTAELEERLSGLTRSVMALRSEMDSEDAARKSIQSTFARSFAAKMEERFIGLEKSLAKVQAEAHGPPTVDPAVVSELKTRLDAAEARLTREARAREALEASTEKQFSDLEKRVLGVQKRVEELSDKLEEQENKGGGGAELVKRVAEEVKADVAAAVAEVRDAVAAREEADRQAAEAVAESAEFVREGKAAWLRVLDFKLAPYRAAREEEAARRATVERELRAAIGEAAGKADRVAEALVADRGAAESSIRAVKQGLDAEKRAREETEEAMTRLLEQTISRLGIDDGM